MIRPLELSDMESIRRWRNQCLPYLRTPFALTKEMQEDWYKNEICNRNSRSRFWAIEVPGKITHTPIESIQGKPKLVGYGGIENIQWENSIGEISLLINPELHGHGYGHAAAIDIIEKAFNVLNLEVVYGEVYHNNPACKFWDLLVKQYHGSTVKLPRRKYWNGVYYGANYFTLQKVASNE